MGGSNGHAVLEEPPRPAHSEIKIEPDQPVIFIVGGLSPRATSKIEMALADLIKGDSSLEVLSQADTHAPRVRQMPFKSHLLYTPDTDIAISNPVLVPKTPPPVVFVTGQGPQHLKWASRYSPPRKSSETPFSNLIRSTRMSSAVR